MLHMMLDIETLALNPKAVVFQIGAVVFDLKGTTQVLYKRHLDILPQIIGGRVVDPETQKWWAEQPRSSWFRMIPEIASVGSALEDINSLFRDGGVSFVWANSPSFDCVILRSLAEDFGVKLAWDFRSEMDLRTLKSMNSIARLTPCEPYVTEHDALKDCLDQVEKVKFYWNNIIGEEPPYSTPG